MHLYAYDVLMMEILERAKPGMNRAVTSQERMQITADMAVMPSGMAAPWPWDLTPCAGRTIRSETTDETMDLCQI